MLHLDQVFFFPLTRVQEQNCMPTRGWLGNVQTVYPISFSFCLKKSNNGKPRFLPYCACTCPPWRASSQTKREWGSPLTMQASNTKKIKALSSPWLEMNMQTLSLNRTIDINYMIQTFGYIFTSPSPWYQKYIFMGIHCTICDSCPYTHMCGTKM